MWWQYIHAIIWGVGGVPPNPFPALSACVRRPTDIMLRYTGLLLHAKKNTHRSALFVYLRHLSIEPDVCSLLLDPSYRMLHFHFQAVIDANDKGMEFDLSKVPQIRDRIEMHRVMPSIAILTRMSRARRARAIADGAFYLNMPLPDFKFEEDASGRTRITECQVEQENDAKRLIEQFMILANCTVAEFLHARAGEGEEIVLRTHDLPKASSVDSTFATLRKEGYPVPENVSDRKALSDCIAMWKVTFFLFFWRSFLFICFRAVLL